MPAPRATAPYQFVPANDPIGFPDTMPSACGISGQMEIKITALEPVLVCGAQERNQTRTFFEVNDRHCIPGSSLKGVFRTIVEAMSLSKLNQTAERRMFFRDLKDRRYMEAFVNNTPGQPVDFLSRAGYLNRTPHGWMITECEWAKIESRDLERCTNFSFSPNMKKPNDRIEEVLRSNITEGLTCALPLIEAFHHPRPQNPNLQLNYRRVRNVTVIGPCRLVVAGYMNNRHYEAIFFPPAEKANQIKVSDECWNDFDAWLETRKDRRKRFDILRRETGAKDAYPEGIPIFWIPNNNGGIRAFGFSQLFSLPYKQRVDQLIIPPDGDADVLSFADAMFGCVNNRNDKKRARTRRGRVSVCAAWAIGQRVQPLATKRVIPGNPSATCLGMYLIQKPPDQINRQPSDHGLQTYDDSDDDSDPMLRGRKFYWHRKGAWTAEPAAAIVGGDVTSDYAPLAAGIIFIGKVIFERLTELEFGALLEALVFPAGHAHKIGLGKSFGLGSVRIDVTKVDATSTSIRYRSLRGRAAPINVDIRCYQDKFKCEVARWANVKSFEDIDEIKALRKLTNYETSQPFQDTRFMALERANRDDFASSVYANKPVLPPMI